LLDTLGVQRAAIVGHSFGGMLAIYFARIYPDMTAALVLENPIGLEDYRGTIPPQTLATLFATEMAQTPDSYRTFMKAFFTGRTTVKELADGQLVEIDGAGHVSHLERPQEFLGALTKFLASRM